MKTSNMILLTVVLTLAGTITTVLLMTRGL